MRYCPDCGKKVKKVKEKSEKHQGTRMLYRCSGCEHEWMVEYDEIEQESTIYRYITEDDDE